MITRTETNAGEPGNILNDRRLIQPQLSAQDLAILSLNFGVKGALHDWIARRSRNQGKTDDANTEKRWDRLKQAADDVAEHRYVIREPCCVLRVQF